MTSTQEDVRTTADAIRVVFNEDWLSHSILQRRLDQFLDLVVVCTPPTRITGTVTIGGPEGSSTTAEQVNFPSDRDRVAEEIDFRRLSYNSPLEWIAVVGATGTVLLGLANKWAEVRGNLARSKTIVRSQEVQQAALELVQNHVREQVKDLREVARVLAEHEAQQAIRGAAALLNDVQSITAADDLPEAPSS